ncbi:anthranilate phosphoribosyltransferase [SAR92 clade bacterium H231]|nr:anthranilate phosphoribosyltransferase [Porticoccaceae bacterium]MCT2533095.1 anthranilate phosphoribosyltransferase [SAR92 clade bacterium H231]MDA8978599.1 anthranilate phosphoribosyltransferase [bacterium]MBT6318971.1 anthranilate phosphoribosyltransferase [Porticoccaceae bacterium]MBT7259302.1 anthranilate phosphoribosyltransferase [Porticoccaceae bacterium]
MDIKTALEALVSGQHLSSAEMRDLMRQIMTGHATEAQIGAFLVALRIKGETIDEIAGAVEVMRELATAVEVSGDYLVDIVGTGGDESNLFNVSTAATFVVAAAGGRVAKHGNRSVSSNSGAADLLEAAGVNLNLNSAQVALCVEELGLGFMFAPAHHSAMKHAIGPRKELGLRTIFNILGPMTNPAGVTRQLIGVYKKELCKPMAEVLGRLGAEHIMVVHSDDGLDEISIATETHVAEYRDGALSEYKLQPENYFSERQSLEGLAVENATESLALIIDALGKQTNANGAKAAQLIAINAGAALYVAGCAADMHQGVEMALDAIGSGLAKAKINDLATFTQVQQDG